MPIMSNGSASPSALARPMIVPVRMPGSASGTTWWVIACRFLEAPTPSAASRIEGGTDPIAARVAMMIVGGLVLALMTLPTIIIATRAAIGAVPPSIREAALGVGASKMQAITHHVVPLALPGILTGTIIGLAKALGETAPLLMIGMVAFVVEAPRTPLDPSTALPVQIYMWATSAERGFVERTSGATMVLLAVLICMNLIAVILRRRYERRW